MQCTLSCRMQVVMPSLRGALFATKQSRNNMSCCWIASSQKTLLATTTQQRQIASRSNDAQQHPILKLKRGIT